LYGKNFGWQCVSAECAGWVNLNNLEEYGRQESKDYIQCCDVNHNDSVHRIQFDVLVELHD
jgi:phage anti-repressor protein